MTTTQDSIRLDTMAQELETIKDEVFEMKGMLKDIHTLLAGNPIDRESGGLITDFKDMKKEIDYVKDQLKKYKAYFYALVTLFGIGALKVIVELLMSR